MTAPTGPGWWLRSVSGCGGGVHEYVESVFEADGRLWFSDPSCVPRVQPVDDHVWIGRMVLEQTSHPETGEDLRQGCQGCGHEKTLWKCTHLVPAKRVAWLWRQQDFHDWTADLSHRSANAVRAVWSDEGWQCAILWNGGHDLRLVARRQA